MPTYVFSYFLIDDVQNATNPLTITLSGNSTVMAVYTLKKYQLTLVSSPVNVPVSVGGISQGNTPVILNIEGGTYQISVPAEVSI